MLIDTLPLTAGGLIGIWLFSVVAFDKQPEPFLLVVWAIVILWRVVAAVRHWNRRTG